MDNNIGSGAYDVIDAPVRAVGTTVAGRVAIGSESLVDIGADIDMTCSAPRKHYLRTALRFLDASLKRDLDVISALGFLVMFSPVFVIIALMIALADGGPVLFAHKRIGRNGKSFGCWKFRTMMLDAEECLHGYLHYHPEAAEEWQRAHKLTADPRVTSIGALLRRTSLDEIPQMWNVLIGQMSLVGPRPVTEIEMKDRYGSASKLVTSIRPGVTGSWQILPDRNEIDYGERIRLDTMYAMTRCLVSDLGILLHTVPVMFRRTAAR